jgi:hypothetical protein
MLGDGAITPRNRCLGAFKEQRTRFFAQVIEATGLTYETLRKAKAVAELIITFDAMHDEVWTERARLGHESQLRKLDALIASH